MANRESHIDLHRMVLRGRAVEAYTGIPASSRHRAIAEGSFPKPIPLGRRSVGWLVSELDAWLAARVEQRRKGK